MKITNIFLLMILIMISACNKKTPECSDSKVVKLVNTIAYDNIYNQFAEKFYPIRQRMEVPKEKLDKELEQLKLSLYKEIPALDLSKTDYKIENIRLAQFNKDNGSRVCKCVLKTFTKETKEQIGEVNLAYSVELTDDKKDFYVTVYTV
jgi:hypothetical protein